MAKQVDFTRPDYKTELPKWEIVDVCDKGEQSVKDGKKAYLPKPNPTDPSKENTQRYEAYLLRALFVNFTQKTITGLVGQVYAKDPEVKLPTVLDPLIEDVDDTGVTLDQQSKKVVRNVLKFGRGALFVDYPQVAEGDTTSKADIDSGNIRPSIICYDPRSIINWRVEKVGNRNMLTLVVIEEVTNVVDPDDEFVTKAEKVWRVLKLEEGVYKRESWQKRNGSSGNGSFEIIPDSEFIPTKSNGSVWNEIPFTFVGTSNNDSDIDMSPLYDLSVVNIGHYRNSADYEESSFITGQPMYIFAGLTQGWVDKNFKNGLQVGSRAVQFLPVGASGAILQTAPNSMPFEAMGHKERQMVALGAKIVEDRQTQRTATEASIDKVAESSILANIAKNVSAAYEQALQWSMEFVSGSDGKAEIEYQLNTDYEIAKLDPAALQAVIMAWMQMAITEEEMRVRLTKMNLATEDFDDFKSTVGDTPPGLPAPTTPNQGNVNDGS